MIGVVLSEPDELLESGPRLPRWSVLAGALVLAAALLTAVLVKTAGGHHAATPTRTVSNPAPTSSPPEELGTDAVHDIAVDGNGGVLLLTDPPSELIALAGDGSIRHRAPAPATAGLLIAAPDVDRAWVVAPGAGSSEVFAYARSTVRNLAGYRVPATVAAAAAFDGTLWLATDKGVYVLGPPPTVVRLGGFAGAVQTIAADPARRRLLAVSARYELLTVDARGAHVVRRAHNILPESIVVTRDAIWAVGFGQVGGSRQGRVDPRSLAITPVGSTDPQAPQGANAWAGEHVFWIKYAYSGAMVCHDARTGEVVAAFTDTSDPVASVTGTAYALSGGQLTRLRTTAACPG